jgi:hypothetical protein
MKITKRQLRRIIRESLLREAGLDQVKSAFDSGVSDAQEGYDAGSYHDWIEGNRELMAAYDAGYEEGLSTPSRPMPGRREELQKTYGDMDVGVRGKAGY